MPRRHLLLAVATAIAMTLGCRRDTVLRGEVFIVTKSGASVRLGLIQVTAIPERETIAAVERFTATATRDFEEQTKVALAAGVEAERATAAWKAAKLTADAALAAQLEATSPGHAQKLLAEFIAASDRTLDLRKAADEAHHRLGMELEKAERTRSPERLFSLLPKSAQAVRTDANGQFELRLPRGDPLVIAARGTREVGDAKEEYFWLVRLPANGPGAGKLLLSNHNQVTSGSGESLVDVTTIGARRDANREAAAEAASHAEPSPPSPAPKE